MLRTIDIRPWAAWLLAILLYVVYSAKQPGVFTTSELGVLCADALPLIVLALGQGIVILTSGVDLSIGGTFAIGTTLAATHFTNTTTSLEWGAVIIAIGISAGTLNGLFIGVLGLQSFIVTLGTWSIFDGIALQILPTAGGSVPTSYANFLNDATAGLPNPLWIILILVAIWLWFKRIPLGRRIYATGSSRDAARIGGARVSRTLVATYAISGLCASVAALLYAMLTASGDPTSGDGLILPSVAAVVIGGTSLFGGQGGFVGTIAGAFTLTILGYVIFAFGLTSYWTVLADGALLIFAMLAGNGIQTLQRRWKESQSREIDSKP